MADFPKMAPYVVEEILESDSFYTNYKALNTNVDADIGYIITEFNPSFMVRRTEEGGLEPTERFVLEFETALERFVKMSEALVNLNEPFIAPVEEVMELNNTVYVVRLLTKRYKTLDEALGSDPRNFSEAYVLMRPLIQCLIAASKKGIFFQFQPDTIGANSYGQLMVDAMFTWEVSHRQTIVEIIKLFYRLTTGVAYNPTIAENPTIEGMGLPPRLTTTMKDILTSEPAYGSIEDFSRQLRSVMDVEGDKEILLDKPADSEETKKSREPKKMKKSTVIAILAATGVLLLALVAVPLFLIFGPEREEIMQYASAYYDEYFARYTNGGLGEYFTRYFDQYEGYFDDETEVYVPTAFVRLHIAYAITDPIDPSVMLNGSIYEHGSYVFRSMYQDGFGLARGTEMLLRGVRPAFIAAHGDFIYFSDGLSGYNLRRVRTDGTGLETVSAEMTSFLRVYGNSLFYTNHSNRDFLYRLDLNTMQSAVFLRLAAYETLVHAGRLYFINGSSGFRIYSVPIDEPNARPERVNDANSDNLRAAQGDIFYRNVEDYSIGRLGGAFEAPVRAASFDVNGNTMAIVEAESQVLWLYDLTRNEALPTGSVASYAAVVRGTADSMRAVFVYYFDSRVTNEASVRF